MRRTLVRTMRAAACTLMLAAVLRPAASRALEGFTFVDRHSLDLDKPECLATLGPHGFAVYDASTRSVVFFDADLKESKRVSPADHPSAPLKDITGLTYDPSRQELLAFAAGQRAILVFDMMSELVRTIDLRIKSPEALSKPVAMALDQNGLLYVTDRGEDDIKTFTAQGVFLRNVCRPRTTDGKRPDLALTGAAVIEDGSVVGLDPSRRSIRVFARDGRYVGRSVLGGPYRSLRKLIATRAGEYISFDDKEEKIYKWTKTGELTGVFGARGTGRGRFGDIADVVCDAEGRVLALDRKHRDIQVFSFDTPCIDLAGNAPPPAYAVAFTGCEPGPRPVAMVPQGLVYFDREEHVVEVRQGSARRAFSHPDLEAVSAAFLGRKKCYFFDRALHRVFVFHADTQEFDFAFEGSRRGAGSLDDVVRILPGAAHTLYFADADDTEVKVFSEDGIHSTSFGTKKRDEDVQIGRLADIVWYNGNLAVADGRRNIIHIFDPAGTFVRNLVPLFRRTDGELDSLAVDAHGFLMVMDRKRAVLYALSDQGRVMFQFGGRGEREFDWDKPEAFTVDTDGTVWVYDRGRGGRLLRYTLRTPGPLGRAEAAIRKKDWPVVRENLEPFLSAGYVDDATAPPGYGRAMVLALEADLVFEEGFLNGNQRERARAFVRDAVARSPEDVATQRLLAMSLHSEGRTEDAIALLRARHEASPDARYESLIKEYEKALEASGAAQWKVTILHCELPVVLPAMYQGYYERPEIGLTLVNRGGKPTPPGKALFLARAVMDNPTETGVPSIPPFSTLTVPIRATFNRNILTYVEPTRIAAEVAVRFGEDGGEAAVKQNPSFELLGRNSIDWAQESMIACFVTPQDPDIQVFSRRALLAAEAQTIQAGLDAHLYTALTLFDGMSSVGIHYAPDPKQPFNYSELSGKRQIDYLQYPRETLARLSGDCDDLAVLYASLLEGAGVPVILVTSPGHIFTAFALKNGAQAVDALGLSPDLLLEHSGVHYVPVETTLVGSPFISAWRVAADTIAKYQPEGQIGYIQLSGARETFKTVSLPPHEHEVPLPTTTALGVLLKRELDALNLKQVERRLAVYKRWLEREPTNVKLLMLLARSYGEVGVFDVALEYAGKARELAPDSPATLQALGNIAFMQNELADAVKWYQQADKLEHTAAVQVNLALSYLKDGQLVAARKAYAEAKKLDQELVNGYPELKQLLE